MTMMPLRAAAGCLPCAALLLAAAAWASAAPEAEEADEASCLAVRVKAEAAEPAERERPSGARSDRLARLRAYEATVAEIVEAAFENVTGLGTDITVPPKESATWETCGSVDWTNIFEDVKENGWGAGKSGVVKLYDSLGCNGEFENDDTCLAIKATFVATTKLVEAFPEGPIYANYLVNNWGDYPSWANGTVTDVDQENMPPTATVNDRNGVIAYGLCDTLHVILTESPNQVGTGTCGWIATLGVLSHKAPAKALKMATRLLWSAKMTPTLAFPCPEIVEDQFPGLVPFLGKNNTWHPEEAANYPYAQADKACGGNANDCATSVDQPYDPYGLSGMWITSLISAWRQDVGEAGGGAACTGNNSMILMYPGMSKEKEALAKEQQGQGNNNALWVCNEVVDPLTKSCEYKFNFDTCPPGLDNAACTAAKLADLSPSDAEGYAAWTLGLYPQFTEGLLKEACDASAATLIINADPLYGKPPGTACDHAVYLLHCDEEHDNYTIWSWGQRFYLNQSTLVGAEPGDLEAIAKEAGATVEQLQNYTRSSNPFGGMVCSSFNAQQVTFAPVPASF